MSILTRSIFGHGAVSDPASPYREWYHFRHYPDSYDCWWNMPTLPNVEELTPSYVNYIIEDEDSVIAHWLRLGADGYRLDVVDELPDEFVAKLKRRMRAVKPESILLGEVWEDASNKRAYGVSRRYFVDAELDSVMNYPWRKAILAFAKGEDDGTGFGEAVMTIAEHYPPQVLNSVMNLLGSHDTTRLLTELSGVQANSREEKAAVRLTEEQRRLAIERERLAAFLQFTLPGIPSIYYGDEVGMEGFDDPFCRAFYDWENGDEALRAYYRGLSRLRNEVGGAAPGYGACARGRAGENCLPARDGGAKSDGFRQLYRQKLAASGRLCPLRLHNVCRQGEKYLASGRLLCAISPKSVE